MGPGSSSSLSPMGRVTMAEFQSHYFPPAFSQSDVLPSLTSPLPSTSTLTLQPADFQQAVSSSLQSFSSQRSSSGATPSSVILSTSPAFTYDSVRRELANRSSELIARSSMDTQLVSRSNLDTTTHHLISRSSLDSHLLSRSSLDSQDSINQSLASPHNDDHHMEEDFR